MAAVIGQRRSWGPATSQQRLNGAHSSQLRPQWRAASRPVPSSDADVFGGGSNPFRRSAKMARLEAALIVAESALSPRKLMQHGKLANVTEVRTLVELLNHAYDQSRTAFRIERVATGFQLLTRPKFATWLDKLHQRQARLKLSPPIMETLSIVAYRQPITRADVEAVRGVQTSEMLKQLMERGLIKIVGEDDSLGRPYLYGTTRQFLESFGLQNLDDMPMADRLRVLPVPSIDTEADTDAAHDDDDQVVDPDSEDVAQDVLDDAA